MTRRPQTIQAKSLIEVQYSKHEAVGISIYENKHSAMGSVVRVSMI